MILKRVRIIRSTLRKIKMKKNTKIFWRTVKYTSVWILAFAILIYGISESYLQIRRIGFGEYKNAVQYKDGVLTVLDFEI